MPVTLYGFASCDTVKKARKWLEANGVEHAFFDYRKQALDPKVVDGWFKRAGWEKVFNTNSTSFKELPEAERAGINERAARSLILSDTNMIKRPVLDTGSQLQFGFKPDAYAAAFGEG